MATVERLLKSEGKGCELAIEFTQAALIELLIQ